MNNSVRTQIEEVQRMTVGALREKYRKLCGGLIFLFPKQRITGELEHVIAVRSAPRVLEIHREMTCGGNNQQIELATQAELRRLQPHVEVPFPRIQLISLQSPALFQSVQPEFLFSAALHFHGDFPLHRHHRIVENDAWAILILLQVIDPQRHPHRLPHKFFHWNQFSPPLVIGGKLDSSCCLLDPLDSRSGALPVFVFRFSGVSSVLGMSIKR